MAARLPSAQSSLESSPENFMSEEEAGFAKPANGLAQSACLYIKRMAHAARQFVRIQKAFHAI